MNRRGGKNRRDRGSRMKDDYGIDDRDHAFNTTLKDRNESRYERPERMGSTIFEKSNRQDRGGGSVWMDRNRDRNSNIGGPQTRRVTQEGEMDTSWRRGGSGNITNDHFNEVEGSDNGMYGGGAMNYVENRTLARSGGGGGPRSRVNEGLYIDRNDCCNNSQEFDASGNHVNNNGQQTQTDRQTPRQKIDNFADNVDSNKKHGGNRGIGNAANNDNRNSPEIKEGFNAKEIMDWMCERHNAVIKAFKNQNECKRSGSQPSAYEIKMYTPTDRCWSQRPIIPSKDDFFQQLERAINQYKAYSGGGTLTSVSAPGNDANNRPIQNRTPMNQSGIGGPVGQRMQHYMQGQINLSQSIMGNVHQQQPQFSPGGLVSTPQQRHTSHPMSYAASPMTPSHAQQQLPQMIPTFLQQQQNAQFPLQQEIVQLHSQSPHAGLIPAAATPNMPPPHIFQQYLVHQHLMHTQLQQCQSLQTPCGIPPQSNFMNTPHPPINPLSLSQQQPVFPLVGQHNIQQPHLPLNSYLQSVCPAPNIEQMQPPLASAEILNLPCTNTPTAGNIFTASTTNSGGSNFSQPPAEKLPKQQQTLPQNRDRGNGGKDFECSSTDSIGSIREEGAAGNGTPSRQRCDKGVACLSSFRSQDSIDSNNRAGGPLQYRGGNGGDRRTQENNNKDRNNIENSNGYHRESWSRQNSKECFQRRNYTAPTHDQKNSNNGNIDNQANNDTIAAVSGSNDNVIANNNSKRGDNFNNTNNNRQNVVAPPPPAVAENQENNSNGQTFQQPSNNNISGNNNNNNQHMGRSSLSYSGTNKSQRKDRNYVNDRDNKNENLNIKGTLNEKEVAAADQRIENRSNSKNYKHNTNINNETEICNNENSDDSTKTNNEKNSKGSPLSTSTSVPVSVPSPPSVGGGGSNLQPQLDSKIRTERETRNNSNASNN